MSTIGGTANAIFVSERGGEQVTFPLCNENGGLKEDWEWVRINHELLTYKLVNKHQGYRLIWDFYFDDWADGSTLMAFKTLKNSLDLDNVWYLYPRYEEQFQGRRFAVQCTSDNFAVILDSAGEWHTGFHIQFKSTDLVDSIDWQLTNVPGAVIYYAVEIDSVAFNS